jgi:hypothetical protein
MLAMCGTVGEGMPVPDRKLAIAAVLASIAAVAAWPSTAAACGMCVFRGASSDGTKVAFETTDAFPGLDDADSVVDLYERDVLAGVTTMESVGQVSGNDVYPVQPQGISSDGSTVFWWTDEQMTSTDTDAVRDIYKRSGGVTTQVSQGAINGNGPNLAQFNGATSDGSKVFFTTDEQLASTDTDSGGDVYERSGGTTTQVSQGAINGNGAYHANFVRATSDGSKVFFKTDEQLASTDTDSEIDLYERSGGTTTQVSQGAVNGNGAYGIGISVSASTDGSKVFFLTDEQLASTDTDSSTDIYERSGSTTTQVSQGAVNGNGANQVSLTGVSSDGSKVFFSTNEPLASTDTDTRPDLYERSGGTTTTQVSQGEINGNGLFGVGMQGASTDGSRVFFLTDEPLVSADDDTVTDVYERSGGTTTLVSLDEANGNSTDQATFAGAASDGSTVYFMANRNVYERSGGATTLVALGAVGFPITVNRVSDDGSKVIFTTANSMASNDIDNHPDVYEGSDGTVTLVSTKNRPAPPTFTGTDPDSPVNENNPKILGNENEAATIDLYTNASCSGTPVASDATFNFISPGITVSVSDDSTTTFYARATDPAGNVSDCSTSSITYVEQSTPPATDTDGDGVPDASDACPGVAANTPDGCPLPAGPGGGSPGGAAPSDTTPPDATITSTKRHHLGRTLGVDVRATTEDLWATVSGTVSVPGSARVYTLRGASESFVAGGTKSALKLQVPKRARSAANRSLRAGHTIKVRLKLSARDAAGNVTIRNLTLKLHR